MASRRIFDLIFKTKGLDTAKSQTEQLDSSFNNLASTAKTIAVGFVSMQTAMKALEMAKLAAQTETVRKSFNNLAKEPDKMLQSMKKATAGTISEMELMQKFNEASLLGLPLERFDEMLEIARGAAQATGQSMDFMLQSVVVALGRQSKLMLDNLGIMIDTQKANERHAESIGKVASKLTDQEKKQAFVNEALRLGQANLQAMGGVSESSVDKFAALTAAFTDMNTAIGEKLLPSILPFVEGLTNLITIPVSENIRSQAAEFNSLFEVLEDVNIEESSRIQAFDILNEKYPELLKNIDLQKSTAQELAQAQKDANIEFEKQIKLQVAQEELKDQLKELVAAERELFNLRKDATDPLAQLNQGSGKFVQENDRLNQRIQAQQELVNNLKIEYGDLNAALIEQGFTITKNNEVSTALNETANIMKDTFAGLGEIEVFTEEDVMLIDSTAEAVENLTVKTSKAAENFSKAQKEKKDFAQALKVGGEMFGTLGGIATSTSSLLGTLAGADKQRQIQALEIARIAAIANIAQGVTKALAQGGILGFATGASVAAAGAAQISTISNQIAELQAARFGMDEMLSKPTLILAGEAGPERVQVTPADRPSSKGGNGMTINFNGPVTNKEFIRDTVLPEIQRVQDLGLA
jgi:hypothetical protein